MADMLTQRRSSDVPKTIVQAPALGVPFAAVATPSRKTLLEPGHEAEWAELNREKREYLRKQALALTPSQRIAQGQRLSQQAVALLASAIRAGRVPRRAFWS